MSKPSKITTREKVEQAITNLKRGKKKLSIAKIAEKAGVERKTIYNNPDIREFCNQAIQIQKGKQEAKAGVADSPGENKVPSERERLKDRVRKLTEGLAIEQEKNSKILEKDRQLVVENAQLKSRVEMLENQIRGEREKKVRKIKG
jgi:hypothetical protein